MTWRSAAAVAGLLAWLAHGSGTGDTAARGVFVDPATNMRLVELPAGSFEMGSPPGERGRGDDEVLHHVTIAKPFLLGAHEVTQEEWRAVMHTSPSHFSACGERCPVENVNYGDVGAFIAGLNARSHELTYRLPTEAEWEYGCRAGTTTPFATGANLTTDQANYNGRFPYAAFPPGEYRERPTAVESFPPNAWGLFDMSGNVWEWTADWYRPYSAPSQGADDPATGGKKVIRGGSWYFDANSARCALRYTHAPVDRGFSLGVRVAADRTARR